MTAEVAATSFSGAAGTTLGDIDIKALDASKLALDIEVLDLHGLGVCDKYTCWKDECHSRRDCGHCCAGVFE